MRAGGWRNVRRGAVASLLVAVSATAGSMVAGAQSAPVLDCDNVKVPGVLVLSREEGASGAATPEAAAAEVSDHLTDIYPPDIATKAELGAALQTSLDSEIKSDSDSWLIEVDGRYRMEVSTTKLPDGTYALDGAVFC